VFDFVPGSSQRLIVVAGLDGYSFKFGSVYGPEFLLLLETGISPVRGFDFPGVDNDENDKNSNFILQAIYSIFAQLLRRMGQHGKNKDE
jgi:hypothetical protein